MWNGCPNSAVCLALWAVAAAFLDLPQITQAAQPTQPANSHVSAWNHQRIRLLLDLGRLDEARLACQQGMQRHPHQRHAFAEWLAWVEIGRAEGAFARSDFTGARGHYDRAFHLHRPTALLTRDRWAFCHFHLLVGETGARGPGGSHWARLEQKVRSILKVVPDHRYGHYLLGVILESRGKSRQAHAAYARVVPRLASRLGTTQADLEVLRDAAFKAATRRDVPTGPRHIDPRWRVTKPGPWKVRRTRNFLIRHHSDFVADRLAAAVEYLRYYLYQKWGARIPDKPWEPPCELRVFRSANEYAAASGRGPSAPGHAIITAQGRTVVTRRIDCRQDDAELIPSVLPHEITHLVVFDLVAPDPLPRWADEGMAVHCEHPLKKWRHASVLDKASRTGRLFPIHVLIALKDYPGPDRLDVFYAQSGSLVEFFLDRASTTRFIRFADGLNEANINDRLRSSYGMSGVSELSRMWQPRLVDR